MAQQKVERDARIVADRAAGLTWPTIARRHDLSERQCQEILRAHRASRPLFEARDPVEAVSEVVEQLDSIVEKFALVAGRPNTRRSESAPSAASSRRWRSGSPS
jgi:hypothetical protein